MHGPNTEEDTRNLEASKLYERFYNEDVTRLVREVYAPDCEVHCMGGPTIRGGDELLRVEQKILQAAPKRRMRVDHRHTVGSVVVVEAVITDPARGADWELPFVAVLKFRDGKITIDRSYAEWPKWPGL